MRLLILLAGIVVLILALRSLLLPAPRRKTRETAQTPEKMVSCAQCRLYLPESEAMAADDRFFCDHEHHRAWLEDRRGKKL